MRRLLTAAACVALPACSAGAPAVVAKPRTATTAAPDVEPDFAVPAPAPTTIAVPSRPSPPLPPTELNPPELDDEPPANSVANGALPVDVSRSAVLACIRSFEGDYTTSTGNGFEGAYQFLPSTWRYAVALAGYPEYADWPASKAPPWVQDAAAWALYEAMGFGPWPPALRWCRS